MACDSVNPRQPSLATGLPSGRGSPRVPNSFWRVSHEAISILQFLQFMGGIGVNDPNDPFEGKEKTLNADDCQ